MSVCVHRHSCAHTHTHHACTHTYTHTCTHTDKHAYITKHTHHMRVSQNSLTKAVPNTESHAGSFIYPFLKITIFWNRSFILWDPWDPYFEKPPYVSVES